MPIPMLLTMLCLVGVTFYVRFLLAVCKECRAHRVFSWMRLRAPSNLYAFPQEAEHKKPVRRAA
jgi:hypothetical protein